MICSGQYVPSLRWLLMPGISTERAKRLRKRAIAPESGTLGDIEFVFFGAARTERYASYKHPADIMLQEARLRNSHYEDELADHVRQEPPADNTQQRVAEPHCKTRPDDEARIQSGRSAQKPLPMRAPHRGPQNRTTHKTSSSLQLVQTTTTTSNEMMSEQEESTIDPNKLIKAGLDEKDINLSVEAGYQLSAKRDEEQQNFKPWPNCIPLI
ncbi:hypothetical protein R1flu_027342 [Riccia fluitans]|uniref:Uncharacterized protein n=1 Tax=Riccia fluitans TaxID=41844 RepID=A0ABD1XII2_9MARC